MSTTPIADYALLSDRHSAALVARTGRWTGCAFRVSTVPRSSLAYWRGSRPLVIRATGTERVTRRYLDRTMVLETTYRTPTGTVVGSTPWPWARATRATNLGRDAHVLLRQATCTEGEVEMELEYAPPPRIWADLPSAGSRRGGLTAIGGADVLVLSSPVAWPRIDRRPLGGCAFAGARTLPSHYTTASRPRGARPGVRPSPDRRAVSRHRVGVGVVVELHQAYVGRGTTWCTTAAGYCRLCRSSRPGPFVPQPPRLYPRLSGVPVTGTTGTPGCVMPPSPSRPSGWRPVPTRPTNSSST